MAALFPVWAVTVGAAHIHIWGLCRYAVISPVRCPGNEVAGSSGEFV